MAKKTPAEHRVMTEIVNFPNERAKAISEACGWLSRMDCGALSDQEKLDLNEWVNRSELHKTELARLAQLWDDIDDAAVNDVPVEVASSYLDVYPQATSRESKKTPRRLGRFVISIAASMLILLTFGLFLHFHNMYQFESTNGKYVTNIGGQQSVLLSDGTEVRLNTDTLIEVNYHDGERNIHLYKGEAHFDVAHDAEKPFTVKARKGDVTALGTVFSVRVKDNRVNVLVEEGKVRIRANENTAYIPNEVKQEQPTKLEEVVKNTIVVANAGNNVVFGEQEIESIVQEEKEVLERKFSWRQGMLAFDDEPLSNVIEEVSRYTSNKIIIADPSIRSLRVGGYYPIGKIQTIFDALELNLGLEIKKVDERTYYITQNGA